MQTTSNPPNGNGFSLRAKMTLLSTAAFSGILLVAILSILLLNEVRIGGSTYRTIQANNNALENIALLKSDLYQISNEMQNFMLETDPATIDKIVTTVKRLTGDIDNKFGIVQKSMNAPGEREAMNKAYTIWSEYKKTLLNEVVPAAERGDVLKASYLMTGLQTQRFNIFSTAVTAMVETLHRDVSTAERQASSSIATKITTTATAGLVIIVLIAILSYLITLSITRPLRACVDFARTVADGRLDSRLEIKAGGETGALATAMNTMAENLQGMVSRVDTASDELTSIDHNIEKASRQVVNSAKLQKETVAETSQAVELINMSVQDISNDIDKLAVSASETSSSILEMAASIEEVAINADKLGGTVNEVSSSIIEMATSIKEIDVSIANLLDASSTTASSIAEMDATIKQVEKSAMDTSAISEGVKNDAETGKKAVEEAIAGMQDIRRSSHITAEVIENLSLKANDIGTILSVIDEVAEQTNLLALNAAIIAAQAGEHGKGFAVVADEIRELSERTSTSTREIATVIKGVQNETARAVEAISLAEQYISEGEKLSQHSGTALEKIVDGVQKASIQVREIARATVEQARGSQSIKEAMTSVEEMVGHIATSAREHSRGSDLIASAVESMKDLTIHVRTSTREQSRAGSLIARSTEDVTSMIDQIRDACRSQGTNSAQILKAVGNIQLSSTANAEAADLMEQAVTSLSKQIDLLKKEMAGFKI
ncbi:methyl-accepting chemotaxis protein [Geobacter sp. AOG2]|uniref:methyl-accepting chemotaxis protein n=1 Tax=Geobacter sp. AOG2 TaxID=1566347 RepID=UPI001CC35081|nr:methyl-accepting chemotaxis protein [Geobacter sp. AOG2]GFE61685.1 methyl-accepting chemotaxis protein [Geobacter sp. AOG2]